MPRDPKTPVTFNLPDNDSVSLVTWEHVIDKISTGLAPSLDAMESINKSLEVIDNKLSQLIEEKETE